MACNTGAVTVSNINIQGQELVQIILKLNLEEEDAVFKMILDKHVLLAESIEILKGKIQKNLSKIFKKKRREVRKLDNPPSLHDKPEVSIGLYSQGDQVDSKMNGIKAWQIATSVKLVVGNNAKSISVLGNPPQIKMLKLGDCLIVGYPLYPRIETIFCNISDCAFNWFRSKSCEEITEVASGPDDAWELVGEYITYIPTNSDVGCRLKIACVPSDGQQTGEIECFISKKKVIEGPQESLSLKRQAHCASQNCEESFRVICYNVLASYYADTDTSTEWLYPYCPTEALALDYRIKLIFKEIQGYNPDIVALQEVDQKSFDYYLNPLMEAEGFQGWIKIKRRTISQGIVIFARKSKFKILKSHGIKTPDMLSLDPMYKDLFDLTSTSQDFHIKILTAKCALQVIALESVEKPGEIVIVGNTHLTSQIRGCNVRLLQMIVILRHLQHIKGLYEKQGYKTSVILSGDFNSLPESGVIQLLKEKKLPPNHADWYSGGKVELMKPYDANHSFDWHSACGYPKYTNYVTGFQGCLDYIFIEKDKLKETFLIPMPEHGDIVKHTALPNAEYPSDHLAIGCDLTWRSES